MLTITESIIKVIVLRITAFEFVRITSMNEGVGFFMKHVDFLTKLSRLKVCQYLSVADIQDQVVF